MLQQYPEAGSFINYLRFQKRYSPHTLTSYQNDLEQFLEFLTHTFDTPSIQSVNAPMVRTWLAGLKENKLSARSINRKISTLKSFYKFLMKNGLVESSPMTIINAPKTNKRLPVYVEEEDIRTLFTDIKFS